jgi:hypothetical protein
MKLNSQAVESNQVIIVRLEMVMDWKPYQKILKDLA